MEQTIWYDLIIKQLPVVAFLAIILYGSYKYFSKKLDVKDNIIIEQYKELLQVHSKTISTIEKFSQAMEKNYDIQERTLIALEENSNLLKEVADKASYFKTGTETIERLVANIIKKEK
jgi:ribonuclease I